MVTQCCEDRGQNPQDPSGKKGELDTLYVSEAKGAPCPPGTHCPSSCLRSLLIPTYGAVYLFCLLSASPHWIRSLVSSETFICVVHCCISLA
jgi:hypothetical protein